MELTHDWRSFQAVLYPQRRGNVKTAQSSEARARGPVHLVVEGDRILSVFSETEDLSEWIGASYAEVSKRAEGRALIAYERESVDKLLNETLAQPSYYEQIEQIRKDAKPAHGKAPAVPQHFILKAIDSWWNKVLPSSYGVYVQIEAAQGAKAPGKTLMLIVRRGQISGFFEPDLTSLHKHRMDQPADIVKYLSEKYLVPVQGMFVTAEDWENWSKNPSPWKEIARALKANRTKMVPFRWGLAVLTTTRAFFGV
jgi:hypothetical protein